MDYRLPCCIGLSCHKERLKKLGVLCQKKVSRAGTSNYTPQYLWDVITCPFPWYPLLVQHSSNPADTLRNNDVAIASKRRNFDVITSKWRRFDVITTLSLRHVFSGNVPYHFTAISSCWWASPCWSGRLFHGLWHDPSTKLYGLGSNHWKILNYFRRQLTSEKSVQSTHSLTHLELKLYWHLIFTHHKICLKTCWIYIKLFKVLKNTQSCTLIRGGYIDLFRPRDAYVHISLNWAIFCSVHGTHLFHVTLIYGQFMNPYERLSLKVKSVKNYHSRKHISIVRKCQPFRSGSDMHDDVIKWKRFPLWCFLSSTPE